MLSKVGTTFSVLVCTLCRPRVSVISTCPAGQYLNEEELCEGTPSNTYSLPNAYAPISCPDGQVSEAGSSSVEYCHSSTLNNIASEGIASQSNDAGGNGQAAVAIDGNTDGEWSG